MRNIIMCGGVYRKWDTPRQLLKINGETIVGRTIRLLEEAGETDIAISSNLSAFDSLGVPVLKHNNSYETEEYDLCSGHWVDAFYPTEEPTAYLFGDVVYSPAAIRKIIDTETEGIEFFASCPPFAPEYPKPYAEPFAFKVVDTERFFSAVAEVKRLRTKGVYRREPIAWELWQAIIGGNPNVISYGSYTAINDYTCDIDIKEDLQKMVQVVRG